MVMRYWRAGAVLVLLVAGLALAITQPSTVPADLFAARTANVANGEMLFTAGGCASCHKTTGQEDRLQLGGGLALHSPFGTFKVPNISSDPREGIGAWTEREFANAMLKGTGRKGEHLFPSFPYTSYQRMTLADVRDLYSYMKTLPSVTKPSEPHQLAFPFNVRLLLGGWKMLFLDGAPFRPDSTRSAELNRGAYITEALGHCAECHSGRNLLGGIKATERYAGGATPDGKGWVPNITPHADGIAGWTVKDMISFLDVGLTPDGATVDGEMGAVITNTSKLPSVERAAMAAYLLSLPPRSGSRPAKQ